MLICLCSKEVLCEQPTLSNGAIVLFGWDDNARIDVYGWETHAAHVRNLSKYGVEFCSFKFGHCQADARYKLR